MRTAAGRAFPNEVASAVNMSANYFSAIFSQKMQKTFVEYLTGKRMERAKKLLRETDKSSGEIAQEVGYKDPHYFSYVFKKNMGCSPREYRSGGSVTIVLFGAVAMGTSREETGVLSFNLSAIIRAAIWRLAG